MFVVLKIAKPRKLIEALYGEQRTPKRQICCTDRRRFSPTRIQTTLSRPFISSEFYSIYLCDDATFGFNTNRTATSCYRDRVTIVGAAASAIICPKPLGQRLRVRLTMELAKVSDVERCEQSRAGKRQT
jgi:hypothetical protein